MKYTVRVASSAQEDVDAAFSWLAERTVHAAGWLNGLEKAIEGLAEFPMRWPLARESGDFEEPIRQLLYGKSPHVYRVLFIVRKHMVYVLHVRHGAREALGQSDITLPPEDDSAR